MYFYMRKRNKTMQMSMYVYVAMECRPADGPDWRPDAALGRVHLHQGQAEAADPVGDHQEH